MVLDNEESRFFISELSIKDYLETNKYLHLIEETTNEELLVNIDHIVTISEVNNVSLKLRYKL